MPALLRHRIANRAAFAARRAATAFALALACALTARPAGAATDVGATFLSWWACPGDRNAAPGVPFDCIANSGTVYTLIGTFVLDQNVPNAVSMDADVNFAFTGEASVPHFWQIDLGGCNPTSFTLVKGMPDQCGGHQNAFCNGDSNQCDLVYSAFVFPNSNTMRLSITVGRGIGSPVDLVAGQRYFAFAIDIPMVGAAGCLGCTAPTAIGFSDATIYSIDDQGNLRPPVRVTATFPGANACATANDGYSECQTVPVRRMTWGRLKQMYR